jgi:electron transfer flavoprotein alpha subunit
MSTIVVFVEHAAGAPRRGSLEALGAASALGASVVAGPVRHGRERGRAAVRQARRRARGRARRHRWSPDAAAQGIAAVVTEQKARRVPRLGHLHRPRRRAARGARLLDCTLFSDCTALAKEGETLVVTRPWLAGKLDATLRSSAPVLCATLRPQRLPVRESGGKAEVAKGARARARARPCSRRSRRARAASSTWPRPGGRVSGGRGLKERRTSR